VKRLVISSAVLALALGSTGIAMAEKPEGKSNNGGFKVTGGGQIIAEGQQGAGDTVGFNAHEIDGDDAASPGPADAAKGQFQFVPRGQSGNESAPEEKFHGVVTCLLSGGEAVANENAEDDDNFNEALMEGSARFGGFLRDNPDQAFTVDVTDEGQGNAKNDMILVRLTSAPCADNPEDDDGTAEDMLRLGRGNVKIHNNPDGPSTLAAATQTAAALARLAR
jgi:hypothetical protein